MKQTIKIKDIPKECRPYEKCVKYGPEFLSDEELVAVLLRTGTKGSSSVDMAREILSLCPYEEGLLGIHSLTMDDLKKVHGVGEVKALQIKCLGELSKRIARTTAKRGISFGDPQTIAEYYMESLRHEEQEKMICMMLDTKNHLIGEEVVFKGTVNNSVVSPREIFLTAFKFHAVNIILVHNHPSGDPMPSQADLAITQRIKKAGELIGIRLLDHIIIGDCRYVSFCEKDILQIE